MRYAPLQRYLAEHTERIWAATFNEIERVLGFSLPASALTYPAWWANQQGGGHTQAEAWQAAGWRTRNLDLKGRRVEFERVSGGEAQELRHRHEKDDLFERARTITGIADREALIREGLLALVERDAARRLALLGGTMPDFVAPPRRRFDPA